ncbi:AF4/FMR2 family member 1-like isoform X3 [Pipra filicauda]|uniref:AF4/FMR2 family member 1-like isoform X3 n=1 Tax=Pipra filicauda TaxID=649802 RepID=A0A7R5L7X7_9PASS|nr:AF4/FMR2 family member 1-like isoform X3 [Pipra filicauda]
MEPQDKGKSDESLSEKNRDLLRLEAQEKRRREAPGEKDQFPGKTPIFAKPYKTDNKDALSRRIRNVLGDYNDFKEYMRKNLRKVIWFPKKIKSRSQTRSNCREPSSRQTKTFQSSVTEQPLKNSKTSESSELEPFLEKTNSTDAPSIEDILREMTFTISRPVSPLQSPPKADPSSTKQTNSTDALSIEDILREMTFTISRPVSPLQSPPKAEPSSTKDTDGSAAQNQACSWTTCSSVTVRRAMTTKLLKSLLLHLFLQETVLAHGGHAFPYSPSPGVWHHLCPAAQSQGAAVTQRAPQAWRPTRLWESKGLASPWCTMGPRGTGRRTVTPIQEIRAQSSRD